MLNRQFPLENVGPGDENAAAFSKKGPHAFRGAPTLKTTNMKIYYLNSSHARFVHNIILRCPISNQAQLQHLLHRLYIVEL